MAKIARVTVLLLILDLRYIFIYLTETIGKLAAVMVAVILGWFGKRTSLVLPVLKLLPKVSLLEGNNYFFLSCLICMLHQFAVEGIQHGYSKGWGEFLFECLTQ